MSSVSPSAVINDRYELIRPIGKGGMADVYVGHDRVLGREVALKVLFAEYAVDPNFVERFRREAQAAANLNHPNIVNVFDWGKHGGTYFIAMEYVAGRTLADILRTSERLTAKQAAEIAGEVSAALGFAHAAGLVHRDIKPANILIGTKGTVKVADFGIARALNAPTESNLTQVGAVMGTATYFSPEQAQGAQPDPRSDLYSLGVVMYEMIAGKPPFTGPNPLSIAYMQVHEHPKPLNRIVPDIPRGYEAIVAKLLAKDPSVRYSTADSLREDLRRFHAGEMPVALMAAAPRTAVRPDRTAAGFDPNAAVATSRLPAARQAAGPNAGRPSQQVTAVQRAGSGGPGGSGARARHPSAGDGRPPTGSLPAAAPDERSPSRTGWYALAAFFALIALGVGAFLLFTTLTSESSDSELTIPDYEGEPLQEVIENLAERGLNWRLDDSEVDSRYDAGIVFRTNPGAGTIAQRGTVVTVFYNAIDGQIPDVAGMTVNEARDELADAGFVNVTVRAETSEEVDEGDVIRTEPGAGATIPLGDEVVIVASEGATAGTEADLVEVPYVIQRTEAEAIERITDAGLDYAINRVETNDRQWDGVVMDQNPRQGTAVEEGSTVTINVGEAPAAPDPTRPPPTQATQPAPTQPQPTQPTQPRPTQPTTTTTTTTPPPTSTSTTTLPAP